MEGTCFPLVFMKYFRAFSLSYSFTSRILVKHGKHGQCLHTVPKVEAEYNISFRTQK